MTERLRLTRIFGVAGWQAWHSEGDGFVLAAFGACLLKPKAALALRGLWRLARLWRDSIGSLDPAALRLALALPSEARLEGVALRVELARPARRARAHRFELALRGQRRGTQPPALADGFAWTVFALAAPGMRVFAAMAAALRAAPQGARLTLELTARRSRAPDTLRADFPLRAEAQIDAREGWFPLIRATRIDVAGALAGKGGAWTSSTSHN